jgi:hypothetical protein
MPVSALMCSDSRLSCSRRPRDAGTLVRRLEFSDLRFALRWVTFL